MAVVGGGIFGTTAAIELAADGHRVELFERAADLLLAASGINQYRLHRGYHYPRSTETALDCRNSEPEFRAAFPEAVVDGAEHFYAIAARDSLTSPEDYLAFCRSLDLEYKIEPSPVVRRDGVSLSVRVRESLFDPTILRRLVWQGLEAAGVVVHLDAEITADDLDPFDHVVIATYGGVNRLLPDGAVKQAYQFEVCEKPVIRLPGRYRGQSVVVMDGPFMCFDPLGSSDLFVIGNVVHAIHHVSVGQVPEVPDEFNGLLDAGIIAAPRITNIDRFIASGSELFEQFEEAEHVGSMFTIRAVLPGVDVTDARPTLVREIDDRTITVFSGKIDTCIRAAKETARLVRARATGRTSDATRLAHRPDPAADAAGDDRDGNESAVRKPGPQPVESALERTPEDSWPTSSSSS
ncbi:MAG TPA: FAD-dependent oxidoreductase [Candidatus Limnocylindrales bacterium]|nr:FAD-dependent oxidoreductase [Candidatus Limnocylindrales bacterium]